MIGWQNNGALTDPVSLAWLVTCAALCAAARSRPVLLAPALVAAALAVGTKTTTGPLLVILLAATVWMHRARLRSMWRPLAAAAAARRGLRGRVVPAQPVRARLAAVAVRRDALGHPAAARDGGGQRQLRREPARDDRGGRATSTSRGSSAGSCSWPALAAPLLARGRRAVWIASAAAIVSVLLWAQAPFTGVPPWRCASPRACSPPRATWPPRWRGDRGPRAGGQRGDWRARVAQLLLAAGLAIELVQAFRLDFPEMPSPLTPLAGAAAGAAAIRGRRRISRRVDTPAWRVPPPALVAAVLVAGALLAMPASGYVARHAAAGSSAAGLVEWMARQPADSAGVVGAPGVIGPLAGDRLRRRLEPIPPGTGCRTLRALRRTRYVVLSPGGGADADVRSLVRCLSRPDYRDAVFEAWAPG